MNADPKNVDLRCSSCGKTCREKVKNLIAHPSTCACNECISLCVSLNNSVLPEEDKKVQVDQLKQMWQQQHEFMRLLQQKRGFPDFPTDITSKKGQQFLKDIRNHLMEELFEAGQHLKNSKSHRITELPEVDREAYKEELVDALHLYFELVIASGVSLDELFKAYMGKGETNTLRILSGY